MYHLVKAPRKLHKLTDFLCLTTILGNHRVSFPPNHCFVSIMHLWIIILHKFIIISHLFLSLGTCLSLLVTTSSLLGTCPPLLGTSSLSSGTTFAIRHPLHPSAHVRHWFNFPRQAFFTSTFPNYLGKGRNELTLHAHSHYSQEKPEWG